MEESRISRLRREDCKRTNHDSVFSQWQILVGPTDWENYSLGKDGIERYRTQNLPVSSSCPGLYELGILASHSDLGRKVRHVDPRNVIVAYLGQADNVRTRLQHYGRAGSHLDHGYSICHSNEEKCLCPHRGPGLFKEIFLRGFSIVFRWAPMINKKEAEKTEVQLLHTFDYAWNKGSNGNRRRDDILLKLDKNVSRSYFYNILHHFCDLKSPIFTEKRAGIKINGSIPSSFSDPDAKRIPSIFKFSTSRPNLLSGRCVVNEAYAVCGVALGDGSVCRNRPIEGRKRCGEHKGKRINGSMPKLPAVNGMSGAGGKSGVCSVSLEDGSLCMELPSRGRKRCELHKGMRISTNPSTLQITKPNIGLTNQSVTRDLVSEEDYCICGVTLIDGSVCRSKPVEGRKRCSEHKGKRIGGSTSYTILPKKDSVTEENLTVCGVHLGDGSVCMLTPVSGRKRCARHKGRRVFN